MAYAQTRSARSFARCSILALALAASATLSPAADWSGTIEAIFMDVYGHDPLVLTILQTGPGSPATSRMGYGLETESKLGFRGGLRYRRELWGAGADFFWITTGQQLERRAAAPAGAMLAFEVAGGTFTSSAPDEVLYFQRLEDTDMNAWTFDLYGTRRSGDGPASVDLRFGLRIADFDNDHRTAAGIEGVRGVRTDASSNYGAMRGPLLGVTGRIERGRNAFEGSLAQSVVFGEAQLSNRRRTFTGAFSEDPAVESDATFTTVQDAAIPMTDLRLTWKYRVLRRVAVGVSASASTWWDVPVPPGVVASEASGVALHENTLVFYGLGVLVEID